VSRLELQDQLEGQQTGDTRPLQTVPVPWPFADDAERASEDNIDRILEEFISNMLERWDFRAMRTEIDIDSAAPLAPFLSRNRLLFWTRIEGISTPSQWDRAFLVKYLRWWMGLPLSQDVYPLVLIFVDHNQQTLTIRREKGSDLDVWNFAVKNTAWGGNCLDGFADRERPILFDPLYPVGKRDLDSWLQDVEAKRWCDLQGIVDSVRDFIAGDQTKPMSLIDRQFRNVWSKDILPIRGSRR
jgi:hypothetical protein